MFGSFAPFGYHESCGYEFVYRFLCGHMFSVLLGIYLGEKLLDHMVILFNFLRKCTVFQSEFIILKSHQQQMRVPVSLSPRQHILMFSGIFIYVLFPASTTATPQHTDKFAYKFHESRNLVAHRYIPTSENSTWNVGGTQVHLDR